MTSIQTSVLDNCIRRISHWRVPPNWSAADWFEEVRAQTAAILCQSDDEFDPDRHVPGDAFKYQRIIAGMLTHYRREWRFALRFRPVESEEYPERDTGESGDAMADTDALREAMARLPELDRWLLEQIFWEERSEAEIAQQMEMSQQAVSKRKRAALKTLAGWLDAKPPVEKENCWPLVVKSPEPAF